LKRFAEARSAAQSAQYECNDSAEAKLLLSNIGIAEKNMIVKKSQQQAMAKLLLGWLAATLPGIFGVFMFIKADYSFHVGFLSFISNSLTFIMPSLVGKIITGICAGIACYGHSGGKIYRSICYSPSLRFSSIESKFAVVSIILLTLGLSMLFLSNFLTFLFAIGWILLTFALDA